MSGIRHRLAAAPGRRSSHVHYADRRTGAWRHDSFPLRLAGFSGAADQHPEPGGSRCHDLRRRARYLRPSGCIVNGHPIDRGAFVVKKVKLGRSKIEVSALALGTDLIGSKINQETSFSLFDFFRDNGGTLVDTANFYASWLPGCKGGESETTLGQWMKERKN